jgi:photosystem II stability/assembly factor-like uncharacterized protein
MQHHQTSPRTSPPKGRSGASWRGSEEHTERDALGLTLSARLCLAVMLFSTLSMCALGCAPPPAREVTGARSDVTPSPSNERSPGEQQPLTQAVVEAHNNDVFSLQAKAEPLTRWVAEHAFMTSEVLAGRALGATEAIALTQDNLVGITRDQGASWQFTPHSLGPVSAVGGRQGGPYVTVGHGGSMTLSRDGQRWTALPRYTGEELIAVEVLKDTIVALGARGTLVRAALDGSGGEAKRLPEGFLPSSLARHSNELFAVHASRGFKSADGITWGPAGPDLLPGVHSSARTSLGLCKLGRVGPRRGLNCALYGVAHSVGNLTFVATPNAMTMSGDGGENWRHAPLGITSVNRVFGSTGGPYFAVGDDGGVARSSDGHQWSTRSVGTTHALRNGLIDKTLVVLVGEMGTIVRSEDKGETWTLVPTELGATLKTVTTRDGVLLASGVEVSLESRDRGKTWQQRQAGPRAGAAMPSLKRRDCDGEFPGDGEFCVLSRQHASPSGLPNMTGFDFKGEAGLAFGESGLVAFTSDGGKSWHARHGLDTQRIEHFSVRGNVIVALNRARVAVSSDGGGSFHLARLPPPMLGGFLDAHITASGAVYVCGKKGFIVKSEGPLKQWLPLNTGERNTVQFERLFEVNGNLYAAGNRGELLRSADDGATWHATPLGLKGRLIAMSGRDDSVMAVMAAPQQGGWLLLSHDAGARFAVQRSLHELTDLQQARETHFNWDGARIEWAGKSSPDGGLTWQTRTSWVPAAQDLGDGFTALASHGRLLVSGPKSTDRAEIVLPIDGSRLTCQGGRHCWLIDGEKIYRSGSRM